MLDWLPDVSDSGDWRLLGLKSLTQAQKRVAMPSQEFTLPSAIVLIDCQCFTAPDNWNLAGWASVLIEESSFRAVVVRRPVGLREAALIVAPKSSGVYRLKFDFPRWLPQARLIVKAFVGDDTRPMDQLWRLEQKIDAQTFD